MIVGHHQVLEQTDDEDKNTSKPDINDAKLHLSEEGLLGTAMFSATVLLIGANMLREHIEAAIGDLKKNENIGAKIYDEFIIKTCKSARLLPGAESLDSRRKITVAYRGIVVDEVEIESLLSEVRMRAMAAVKGAATAQKTLALTSVESIMGLADNDGGEGWGQIHPGVVAKAHICPAMPPESMAIGNGNRQ